MECGICGNINVNRVNLIYVNFVELMLILIYKNVGQVNVNFGNFI